MVARHHRIWATYSTLQLSCRDLQLQDIVTASPDFDVEAFIPQLREFLQVQDLKQSVFLIQWITLLASVPDVDMLSHLPQILGGLLDSMTTNFRDVTEAAGRALDVSNLALLASQRSPFAIYSLGDLV